MPPEYTIQDIVGFLNVHNIDVFDCGYKQSSQYESVKDTWVYCDEYGHMSLEEFIERFLLPKEAVMKSYDSIYEMGNPYQLNNEACSVFALALAIVKEEDPVGETEIVKMEQSSCYQDIRAARMARKAQMEAARELENTFIREDGGYLVQLERNMDLDLDQFDNHHPQYPREKIKILYFLYLAKKAHSPKILELFRKPSMENIDYSYIGMETHNGRITQFFKNTIAKELSLNMRTKIIQSLQTISRSWDAFLRERIFQIELIDWPKDSVLPVMDSFLLQATPDFHLHAEQDGYEHSPVETLFLKVLQHELLSYIEDMQKIMAVEPTTDFRVPKEITDAMEDMCRKAIPADKVEQYILKKGEPVDRVLQANQIDL